VIKLATKDLKVSCLNTRAKKTAAKAAGPMAPQRMADGRTITPLGPEPPPTPAKVLSFLREMRLENKGSVVTTKSDSGFERRLIALETKLTTLERENATLRRVLADHPTADEIAAVISNVRDSIENDLCQLLDA